MVRKDADQDAIQRLLACGRRLENILLKLRRSNAWKRCATTKSSTQLTSTEIKAVFSNYCSNGSCDWHNNPSLGTILFCTPSQLRVLTKCTVLHDHEAKEVIIQIPSSTYKILPQLPQEYVQVQSYPTP
eukprot:6109031-Amphidinium_carterae.1